jgi:NAD(P)-dependent dehydrogenase (short-subunit alcohol dehydrogenase family)
MSAPARRLDGAVAVVTGSSTGNGRAIAVELAAEGAKVVCSDVRRSVHPDGADADPEPATDTDQLIRRSGGTAEFVAADVTDEDQVQALADRAIAAFGRLDVWVNNAGIAPAGPIEQEAVASFERAFAVNVTGTWLGCRAAAGAMRSQDRTGRSRGRIVNIGSIAAEMGQGCLSAYASSKGAVHALTRELAIELAPDYINVNALVPGYFTGTGMTRGFRTDAELAAAVQAKHPWPEMAPSRDLGRAVVFLASDDAAWITGAILPVDGGALAR